MTRLPVVLTRRTMLAVSGVAFVGACGAPHDSGHSSGQAAQQKARTDAARDRALTAEADLIARYDAALAQSSVSGDPALAATLSGVRAEHVAHASALREGYGAASTAPANPAAGGTSPAPSSTTASPTPPPTMDTKTAVAGLVAAEQAAASARTSDVLAAEGPTAMLLASIAASESGHAALLLGGTA